MRSDHSRASSVSLAGNEGLFIYPRMPVKRFYLSFLQLWSILALI